MMVIKMEALTILKGVNRAVLAWCPVCQSWIEHVAVDDSGACCLACDTMILRDDINV